MVLLHTIFDLDTVLRLRTDSIFLLLLLFPETVLKLRRCVQSRLFMLKVGHTSNVKLVSFAVSASESECLYSGLKINGVSSSERKLSLCGIYVCVSVLLAVSSLRRLLYTECSQYSHCIIVSSNV